MDCNAYLTLIEPFVVDKAPPSTYDPTKEEAEAEAEEEEEEEEEEEDDAEIEVDSVTAWGTCGGM